VTDQADEQSVQDRMIAVLEAEDAPEEELEAPEEPTEEVEEEQEQEESEEEQPAATVKLKFNGEEIEKPLEEVVNLAQQGLDYTQKTQKLAEERRQVEAQVQAVKAQEQQFQQQVQVQQALINEIAAVTALDQQLAQFQQLDWNALSDNDPVEAQKAFFRYNQLQAQRGQMVAELQHKQNQINQAQAQSFQQLRAQLAETIRNEIPDYTPEKDKAMLETGLEYGFTREELGQVVDPRHIKVLHDAMQWRKLHANPVAQKKVNAAPPVVKPGSRDTKQQQTSQSRQMRDQLRKSGDGALAAKLIERML
jgi:hypothetical protein